MPGENIQDWSVTATNNGNADSSINFAEGQPRASVNNSARSMMAAHAKQRNLHNGSIVTGGTANAQAFFSGLTYTTIPTGLRVLLKIGPSLTNTGAVTFNMDGIGAVAIKDQIGADLGPGALVADQYFEFIYNGTSWVSLWSGASGAVPQCGRLAYVSATALSYLPVNGDRIKIAGINYSIPSAGITGLANTSAFVGGVAAQNLAAATLYYVYVFNNAGVITADFRTGAHSTSATAGNIGTEILTGDDTRSLIGLCYSNGSAQFANDAAHRQVISWFNRRNIRVQGPAGSGLAPPGGPYEIVNSKAYFLTWAEEDIAASCYGTSNNDTAGFGVSHLYVYADATTQMNQTVPTNFQPIASYAAAISCAGSATLSEGFHWISAFCSASGGSSNFEAAVETMIRG